MPSETLRKVTLNLYKEDVEFFEKRFGHGWSSELRRIMRREVMNYNKRDKIDEIYTGPVYRGDDS